MHDGISAAASSATLLVVASAGVGADMLNDGMNEVLSDMLSVDGF